MSSSRPLFTWGSVTEAAARGKLNGIVELDSQKVPNFVKESELHLCS